MGRQAAGMLRYLGQEGPSNLHLESHEIIARGAVRAKIARRDLLAFAAKGDDLVLTTAQGELVAGLGAAEAAAWIKALHKPLPTLREKLGLTGGRMGFAATPLEDEALIGALHECQTLQRDEAALAIAQLCSEAELDRALAISGDLPLWCVTVKGKASPFSDNQSRALLRARGYVDTKSCAVSQNLTATRWQRRAGA